VGHFLKDQKSNRRSHLPGYSAWEITSNRRFDFHKSGQLFIRVHNETLAVAAMCVCNPDRSPVGINR
jgi:hypothetical protein